MSQNEPNLDVALKDIPIMPFHEMYALYMYLFNIPSKSTRKEFYIWRITNRLQELRFGGLDHKTRTLLENMEEPEVENKSYPIGAEIIRKFKGETYKLRVLDEGYELRGQIYKSLSGAAFALTSRKISGREFFGVGK